MNTDISADEINYDDIIEYELSCLDDKSDTEENYNDDKFLQTDV